MNRLVLIIFIVLVGIMAGMYWKMSLLQNKLEDAEGFKILYIASEKEVKTWKDDAGQWRAKAEGAEVTAGTLREALKQGDPRITKLINDFPALNRSLKNLESLTQLQAQTISELTGRVTDTLYTKIINGDTIKTPVKKIKTSNKWNNYDVTIIGDSANIKRTGREEIDIAGYWERLNKKGNKTFWPLGKKKISAEGISRNPETKISDLKFILSKKKK